MRYALPILALLAAGAVTIGQVYVLGGSDPPAFIDPYLRVTWVHVADPFETVDANPGGVVELAEWLP